MLVAYFLLQRGKLTAHQPLYLWLNFWGGVVVICSLLQHWNLPAFIMELAWVSISAYSLITLRGKKES